jgi:hypothetical protein
VTNRAREDRGRRLVGETNLQLEIVALEYQFGFAADKRRAVWECRMPT